MNEALSSKTFISIIDYCKAINYFKIVLGQIWQSKEPLCTISTRAKSRLSRVQPLACPLRLSLAESVAFVYWVQPEGRKKERYFSLVTHSVQRMCTLMVGLIQCHWSKNRSKSQRGVKILDQKALFFLHENLQNCHNYCDLVTIDRVN